MMVFLINRPTGYPILCKRGSKFREFRLIILPSPSGYCYFALRYKTRCRIPGTTISVYFEEYGLPESRMFHLIWTILSDLQAAIGRHML